MTTLAERLTYHVRQDGGDFYAYRTIHCNPEDLLLTRTAPFAVMNLEDAKAARKWFLGLASAQARIVFVGA